jgi:secreted trypsin-like serine protease
MKILLVLLVAAFCEARPGVDIPAHPAFFELGAGSFIVGGTAATPGEFPWQLSQERLGGAWSHSCGASLLSANRALSAAHCLEGASVTILRVIANLHDRSQTANAVYANTASYTLHPQYNQGTPTFNNDISIINLATPIGITGWIQYANLPANNNDQFVGQVVVMSGWGRTSASNVLPNVLQRANVNVISNDECNTRMAPVSGASVGAGQICLFTANTGSCNGDSGGPLNHGTGASRLVIGVTSWGIQSGGACLQTYPSVYTRTSNYLSFINPLL